MSNPYNCTRSGHAFVGFASLRDEVLDGLANGHSFGIIGGRRCGKSSMLKQLKDDIGRRGVGAHAARAHFVDVQAMQAPSSGHLFRLFYQHIAEGTNAPPWRTLKAGQGYEHFLAKMDVAKDRLAAALGERWLAVLLVDEMEAAANAMKGDDTFFVNLRHLLMESRFSHRVRLVASGVGQMADLIKSSSPLNNLLTLYMGILEVEPANELIRRGFPGGLPTSAAAALQRLTGRHPYLMQGVLEKLWKERDALLDEAKVQEAGNQFERQHNDFAQWLKVFGPSEHAVYQLLCCAPEGRMSVQQLRAALDGALVESGFDALVRLAYHGVIDDHEPDWPRVAGALFQDWYQRRQSVSTAGRNAVVPTVPPLPTSQPGHEPAPTRIVVTPTPPRRLRTILAVATEWESRHGGLSTFNRSLCTALAAAGHAVVCLVPDTSAGEEEAAHRAGVRLVAPPATPGLSGEQRLLLSRDALDGVTPDIIIGHDRKTGPHARELAKTYSAALRLHFIHTRPEDIEWYKDTFGEGDAASEAEKRRELQRSLAETAALVVAVGPDLEDAAKTLVYGSSPRPRVVRLDPGLDIIERPGDLPPEIICLLSGRAEDDKLKGLDIGTSALNRCAVEHDLRLRAVVRGAPPRTGSQLHRSLVELAPQLQIEVREYTSDVPRLRGDLIAASLVLMPSRSEGFGLVALEAIGSGTPVLISDKSGLATLLRRELGDAAAAPYIVATNDSLDLSAPPWSTKIYAVLFHRTAAFARARELRDALAPRLTWPAAVLVLEAAWAPLLAM